jgi:hypothetical protein
MHANFRIDLSPIRVDPEGKSIIHHILLNANANLLDYLLVNDDIAPYNFGNISMEGNSALHLALALVSVAKYRERCIECVKLIMSYNEQQILLDEE